ncbi:hypothetical protein KKB83_01715 [Patescibacteria group bacterium]|nr:hypothetical protein [Patescibacteria group bacterium]
MSDSVPLPNSIKQLLWEYQGQVDINKHAALVIEKVLDHGTPNDILWLFDNLEQEKIKQVIINSTRIDPKTANFWALKLDINEEIICLQKRSPLKPNKLWKF